MNVFSGFKKKRFERNRYALSSGKLQNWLMKLLKGRTEAESERSFQFIAANFCTC